MDDRKVDSAKTGRAGLPDEASWKIYHVLIDEMRHLHTVWMDNFRVILTFNSILLPGAFAIFALTGKREAGAAQLEQGLSMRLILALAVVGIITTLVMLVIIRRIKAYTVLRQREIREVEKSVARCLPVVPFLDGYVLGGGKDTELARLASPDVKAFLMSRFNSMIGYTLIGLGFIAAYILLAAIAVRSLACGS